MSLVCSENTFYNKPVFRICQLTKIWKRAPTIAVFQLRPTQHVRVNSKFLRACCRSALLLKDKHTLQLQLRQKLKTRIINVQMHTYKSQSSTSSTTLLSGGVRWHWSDILNTTNSQTGSGQSSQGSLATWTWGLGLGTTSTSNFNMHGGDADFLALDGHVLSSQHGSVWGRLISVGLNLHTTSNSGDGFLTRQVSDMDESIVERSKDSGNAKNLGSVTGLNNAVYSNKSYLLVNVTFCNSVLTFKRRSFGLSRIFENPKEQLSE